MLTIVLVEFRVPLHTMDESRSTTYVEKLHSESDSRLDIFDSIKATMDVPDLYGYLAWRLSTARRTDPPHRLLSVHDIDSAFRAARAESSGRRHKKVAIEIINTVCDLMLANSLHNMTYFAGAHTQRKPNKTKGRTRDLQRGSWQTTRPGCASAAEEDVCALFRERLGRQIKRRRT